MTILMKKEKVDSFLVRIKFHLKFPFHIFPQKEPPAGALHYGRPLRLGLTAGSFSSACDTAGRPGIRDKPLGSRVAILRSLRALWIPINLGIRSFGTIRVQGRLRRKVGRGRRLGPKIKVCVCICFLPFIIEFLVVIIAPSFDHCCFLRVTLYLNLSLQ